MASPHTEGLQGFSQATLEKKLQNLNSTLQNIQLMAQWAIHYRKHAKTITSVWYKELQKADSNRKLTLLYLANDIVQNSRKKGTEFKIEFTRVLPRAFHIVSKSRAPVMNVCVVETVTDSPLQSERREFDQSVSRIINIWEERSIFEQDTLTRLKALLASPSLNSRRTRSESDMKHASSAMPKAKKERSVSSDVPPSNNDDKPPNDRSPPDADVLLRRMLAIEGDKSACNDEAIREKIAGFPPEIKDHELLSKLKDKAAADELEAKLVEAEKVLGDHVKRLQEERKERRDLQELLEVFIWQQKQQLRECKNKLKHYQAKLERVTGVKEELTLKLARLPDLSKLPTSSHGSLAPLPSVGDLFN
ncbi:Regulation of nuclear pre-mRNA domain-containing protein 1B [Geodia barretti]|uniref:Regulation of nuclear pre-mRNA domain-containing protein 1B n=1 Tax=Geodia barretti TaxID=519541 RepID=A0AA35T209_GEOBA|nr:Regulation of nuclear pre-mRNA domain-containing protein 1B [Geodia barretti]